MKWDHASCLDDVGKEIIIKRWKKWKATSSEPYLFSLPTKIAEMEWSDHESGDVG